MKGPSPSEPAIRMLPTRLLRGKRRPWRRRQRGLFGLGRRYMASVATPKREPEATDGRTAAKGKREGREGTTRAHRTVTLHTECFVNHMHGGIYGSTLYFVVFRVARSRPAGPSVLQMEILRRDERESMSVGRTDGRKGSFARSQPQ